jgi:ElaB/YqjD/DUF883 family membrane-anchored ribosome-binding protein
MKPSNEKPSEAARFLDNLESALTAADPVGEELAESLRDDGLDPNRVDDDLRQLLEEHAPTWKQKAERERKSALETLSRANAAVSRTRAEIERRIRETVEAMQRLGAPETVGAYHQKFQKAADADLESLLQDLEAQLETMESKKSNE